MIHLNEQLAQNISHKMMEILPYNINIMNEHGIIIGSGDLKRLHTLHEGALEALSKQKMVEIYTPWRGVKPGVNTPIVFNNKSIGVIGITGAPDEVRPFGELVRVTAELLINQEYSFNKRKIYERHKEEILHELAYNTSPYSKSLKEKSLSLGINLEMPLVAIVLKFHEKYNDKIKNSLLEFLESYEFNVTLSSSSICLFVKYDNLIEKRLYNFINNHTNFNIIAGIGLKEEIIGISVKQAINSINIGKKLYDKQRIYSYKNLSFISTLSNFKGEERFIIFINKLEKEGKQANLLKTLITYINNNGELHSTADKLHIHRNTLNYRLEKIHELTNKDPKKLLDLLELYTAYIVSKL
ncbi:CdaR family transcriptional regulator [Clostridium rectalis]|uniref:CdaR family transcriptional regulator n=1 Tax=Clostridium rectalis TaxID=2040295 RepID=UPI000F62E3F4|nr:sugar diacid recognition domain-containing protein [Clostridium rectalis]